jgi:Fe-S cluster assembly ATP-binding protein
VRKRVVSGISIPGGIPGVSNMEFLKASMDSLAKAHNMEQPDAAGFIRQVRTLAESLDLDPQFLKRGVNEGFSGGEKKRNEILQLLLLNPKWQSSMKLTPDST